MSSINIVSILGRVGKEPETKTLQGGNMVANFSIATSETFKDKDGNKKEQTEWHNCVAWGKTAEIVEKYVHKGDQLFITGKLVYEQYEKDNVKHTVAKIRIDKLVMLGGKKAQQSEIPPPLDEQNEDNGDQMPF